MPVLSRPMIGPGLSVACQRVQDLGQAEQQQTPPEIGPGTPVACLGASLPGKAAPTSRGARPTEQRARAGASSNFKGAGADVPGLTAKLVRSAAPLACVMAWGQADPPGTVGRLQTDHALDEASEEEGGRQRDPGRGVDGPGTLPLSQAGCQDGRWRPASRRRQAMLHPEGDMQFQIQLQIPFGMLLDPDACPQIVGAWMAKAPPGQQAGAAAENQPSSASPHWDS